MLNSDNILLIFEYRWNARYSEVVRAGAPSLHMADAVEQWVGRASHDVRV